ncbi:MAG TPA: MFS transporter [Bacteroidia bacterium]|nr:MFS transporter [Bacteroidia bacterium]
MKTIKENNVGISTILAFALIPLSGFATDIYIPSLPSMGNHFHINGSAIQLTIALFMISGGISQLFIGSLLDSFGRYRLSLAAILIFSISSFAIGFAEKIEMVYFLRIIQGITVSIIVVSKRAFFMDMYTGDKLKNYISLFSIVWATAPILAPFIGGFLQVWFGWQSNFYFLGALTLVIFVLELVFSGESLKNFKPFQVNAILSTYSGILKTKDYVLGLTLITLSYSLVVIYGMVSPFIIEHVYHHSAMLTGYSSLLSGAALMLGGIISKSVINKPLAKKMTVALGIQMILATAMAMSSLYAENAFTFIAFTLSIHLVSGFVFNNIFAYCLGRFTSNAGIVSGLTGGGLFALTSIFSYSVVNTTSIINQEDLAIVFLGTIVLLGIMFVFFAREHYKLKNNLSSEVLIEVKEMYTIKEIGNKTKSLNVKGVGTEIIENLSIKETRLVKATNELSK